MDVKKLIQLRLELECDIQAELANLIAVFEGKTGVGVSDVSIDFIKTTCIGEPKALCVSNVTVKLEME